MKIIFAADTTNQLMKSHIDNKKDLALKRLFIKTIKNFSENGGVVGGSTDLRTYRIFEDVQKHSPIPLVDGVSAAVEQCAQYRFFSALVLNSDLTVNHEFRDRLEEKNFSVIKLPKNEHDFIETFCRMKEEAPDWLAKKVEKIVNDKYEQLPFGMLVNDSIHIEKLLSNGPKFKTFNTVILQVEKAFEVAKQRLVPPGQVWTE